MCAACAPNTQTKQKSTNPFITHLNMFFLYRGLFITCALTMLSALAVSNNDNESSLSQTKTTETALLREQLTSVGLHFVNVGNHLIIPFHHNDFQDVVSAETVYIRNTTLSLRNIFGWLDEEHIQPTHQVIEYLMLQNARYAMGAWQLVDDMFVFQCQIAAANTTASELYDIVQFTATILHTTIRELKQRGWMEHSTTLRRTK